MHRGEKPELESLRRSVKSLTTELLAVYEELALLHSLGGRLGRLSDEDQLAATALEQALETLQADCGWVVRWDSEEMRLSAGCCRGLELSLAEQICRTILEPLHFRNKPQVLSQALDQDYGTIPGAPLRLLACALPAAGISAGYLCLGRRSSGRIFTTADQKLLGAVAQLAGVEIENVRLQRSELEKARLESEMELARSVQNALLPRDFRVQNFLDAQGISIPCQKVGGDYFDLLPLGSDCCLLAMADVSGKGPAAALQAAMLQGVVHALARRAVDLPDFMLLLNACLHARAVVGSYATGFFAILDRSGRLRYTNGGHNPPLWIPARGPVRQLTEGGPLLGLLENVRYQQGVIQMAPGDLVVLYTDGVTEAQNDHGEAFGLSRVLDWAGRQAGADPRRAQDSLISTVSRFSSGRSQEDDLTLLAVQFTGSAP